MRASPELANLFNRWLVGEAHRPRMAHERSPIIVAMADGRVVDVGSHDQLMAAKGFCHDSA
jgi:ABC-type multidrug transport system fused ATPase/permease subunit